ncbi:MAG: beta strand repeat-containing protein, partial [Gemmatimonadales bacterium]
IQPNSLPATGPEFTLTVNGTGFANNVVVRWNGDDRVTMFINSTKLEATIPASDIAAAGSATVRVFNPPPGGGPSNSVPFTISLRNPLPTITGLSPAGVIQNSGAFNLMVSGSNFVGSSTVRFNGSDRVTAFINGGQLQAAILAGDVTSAGTGMITVDTPGPGGGTSNTFALPIQASPNLRPSTSGLVPVSATAGATRDTLTVRVNGSSFVARSVVRWNGSNRVTTFFNSNRVDATIPASDLLGAGMAQVTVFTPIPGGGTSNAQTFTINNPSPALAALSPSSAPAGEPGLILTVTGSNFVPGSVVRWNGANRPTTFIGGSQLRATIPASDLAVMGSANVTVFTPGPGGGTSAPQVFTITAP